MYWINIFTWKYSYNMYRLLINMYSMYCNNWKMYKDPQPVVAGTSSRNGRTLKFVDWQNVVAYEVADKNGNLIFISEGLLKADQTASFAIDKDWEEGFKVYAVSAKGERTEIKL